MQLVEQKEVDTVYLLLSISCLPQAVRWLRWCSTSAHPTFTTVKLLTCMNMVTLAQLSFGFSLEGTSESKFVMLM